MAMAQTDAILGHICGLIEAEKTRSLADAELVRLYTSNHDEAAFGGLMRRYGTLVWGVCRRVLHNHSDAEDAFQATFLILARQAGSIKKQSAVGSWLYGVAYRVAVKARKSAHKRLRQERRTSLPASPRSDLAWGELQAILDEEVQRLPEKYRGPFVLCCLESRTREEAMQAFGCREGTLSSRIARAKELLKTRLARRGVTLSAALCAHVLWQDTASAALPRLLARTTGKAAIAASQGVTNGMSTAAIALARSATQVICLTKAQVGLILVLGVGLLIGGVGLMAYPNPSMPANEARSDNSKAEIVKPRKDLFGDPLPPGALARLGTVRQRAPNSQIAVTADGKEIVAVSSDHIVRRLDAATGELLAITHLPKATWSQPWLSPRGTYVLIHHYLESGGYQVQLWNLESKKQVGTLSLGIDWLAHVSFSRDEDTVALTTTNQGKGRVMVWDLKGLESKEIWSLETRIDRQFFHPVVVLSPDAKRVVACHLDLVLRCWDVDTSKLVWESKKKLNSPFIFFSPDGKQLISTSGIGTPEIDIRDAATGDFITEKMKSPEEACYPLGFSPDGKLMVFQTGQEGLVLWEPTAAKVAFTLPAPLRRRDSKTPFNPNWMPHNWAFTPDGKSLIRRCDALQRWNLATGKAVYSDSEDSGHAEDITAVIFSPDGKFVATSASDQTCRLWDLASSRSVHAFPIAGSAHLAFTSDSHQVLALALHLGKIVLGAWDVVTGKKINGFCLADDSEFMSAFTDRQLRVTADGKKVLMLTFKNGRRDEESMLTVWNAAMRECLVHKRVPWNEDSIITPDGDAALAVDPVAGTVRLMDIKTEKPRWSLAPPDRMLKRQGQHYRNWFLAVSPRGRFMASCFHFKNDQAEPNNVEENVIYVGDLATGRERMKLLSSDETIVTFSNDERTLAVAGDQGIRLFETASGHEVGTIKLPPTLYTIPGKGWIRALAFSPDGRTLATGQADATILLWDATLRAGARGGRLTEAQSQSLWTDLSGDDAVRAFTAIWRFVDDPKQAVALLQNRLEPVRSPAAEKVQALVNELDSAEFNVRETAQKQLAEFGQLIAPALREALKSDPSAEKKRRMESIMANLDPNGMVSGPHLREIRAMQILEKIGSAEARELLKKVAQGDESARLTTEAKKALERIER